MVRTFKSCESRDLDGTPCGQRTQMGPKVFDDLAIMLDNRGDFGRAMAIQSGLRSISPYICAARAYRSILESPTVFELTLLLDSNIAICRRDVLDTGHFQQFDQCRLLGQ